MKGHDFVPLLTLTGGQKIKCPPNQLKFDSIRNNYINYEDNNCEKRACLWSSIRKHLFIHKPLQDEEISCFYYYTSFFRIST